MPEKHFNAAQGISGCGPAFVALFVESLVDAGVKQGLSRDLAFKLASSTVLSYLTIMTSDCMKKSSVTLSDVFRSFLFSCSDCSCSGRCLPF